MLNLLLALALACRQTDVSSDRQSALLEVRRAVEEHLQNSGAPPVGTQVEPVAQPPVLVRWGTPAATTTAARSASLGSGADDGHFLHI